MTVPMSGMARFRWIGMPNASLTVELNTLQLLETTMFLSTDGTVAIVCASARVAVACACRGPTVAASTPPPASSANARQPAVPRPVTRRTTLIRCRPFAQRRSGAASCLVAPPGSGRRGCGCSCLLGGAKLGRRVGPPGGGERGRDRGQHRHRQRERDRRGQVVDRDGGRGRQLGGRGERDG